MPAARRPKLAALPDLTRQALRLAPRQINDEIALAKIELKNKGVQAGVGAGLFGVALVFLGLLVIALVVAAILGLATVMPGWLAALIVGGVFLLILVIAALLGLGWVKKALPLLPEDAIRGLRHDLAVVREGRAFDPRLLDPSTIQYKRAQATKEAEKLKARAEKEAQDRVHGKVHLPPPSEKELRERLDKRRDHLLDVREDLVREFDVKLQAANLADDVRHRFASSSVRTTTGGGVGARGAAGGERPGAGEAIRERWAPLAVFTVSATAFVVLLRRLVKS
ncbi:hypothetical protein GCM10028789_13410 [Sinomonas halotolerans]